MAKKKIDIDKYASGLFIRTEQYADKVRRHYATAVDELLKLSAKSHISPDEVFSFSDNKKLSAKANNVLRGLYSAVYNEIKGGVTAEWEYANLSCDALIESIFGKGLKEDNHFARWFSRNQEAMDAFFARKSAYGGMNLSQKVWKYTGDLKTEMELALSLSLGQGDSASTVSRKVRQFLQEPDKLFRRIKTGTDANGNPLYKLSKAAKAYHPGRGVYRSSYKNAMRLTRTETNMAYRAGEQDRWQRMDFVVGYEVKRSKRGYDCSVCESLKGKFPKDFVFKGWHPQCRCYIVPILATDDEFVKMQEKILAGESPTSIRSVNTIRRPHQDFYDWWENNKERVETASAMPYWVQDNQDYINKKRKIRVRTDEEREAIRKKWAERSKKYQTITKMANNVLKVAQEYPEIDLTALQSFIDKRNIASMNTEARSVAKQIVEIKKQEKALADLIPNVRSLHKQYSITELQEAYDELDGVMKKWLSKYGYTSIDAAPLAHLRNKLDFELTSPTIRYSNTEIIKKAITEHISLVNRKIEWNELLSKATTIKSFKTKSPTFKDFIAKIDEAISSNDLDALQKSILEAEKQQQKLLNKYAKPGGIKGALNKQYKGGAVGKDLTSSIDVTKMVSEDPYKGTFTNNVARMQGFDAPAKLVSEQEFVLLEKLSGDVFYRTVNPTTFKGKKMTSAEFAAQLYEADLLELNGPGGRVYGDGMYVATSAWSGSKAYPLTDSRKTSARCSSECYGNGNHTLSKMTWVRKPKIIEQRDLEAKWNKLSKSEQAKYGYERNTYGCALGYDAMFCNGVDYMVIWNRSIIAVKKQ